MWAEIYAERNWGRIANRYLLEGKKNSTLGIVENSTMLGLRKGSSATDFGIHWSFPGQQWSFTFGMKLSGLHLEGVTSIWHLEKLRHQKRECSRSSTFQILPISLSMVVCMLLFVALLQTKIGQGIINGNFRRLQTVSMSTIWHPVGFHSAHKLNWSWLCFGLFYLSLPWSDWNLNNQG